MKKVFSALLCIVFLLLLTSCGQNITSTTDEKDTLILETKVIDINEFGSLLFDIIIDDFEKKGFTPGDSVNIEFKDTTEEDIPYFSGYYGEVGRIMLVADKTQKYISLNKNNMSYVKSSSAKIGDSVKIVLFEKGKYQEEEKLNHLEYTLDRKDYGSDEEFANAREMKVSGIKEKMFYRSSTITSNKINRVKEATEFAKKNNVKMVINLSDDEKSLKTLYKEMTDFTKNLYERGAIIAIKQSVDFQSDEFIQGHIKALNEISNNEGPYLIHCVEGKDRTGYFCALVEILAGGTYDEIINDYFITFKNYYGITKENNARSYNYIKDTKIDTYLSFITSVEKKDLANTDLLSKVEHYLLSNGMSQEQLENVEKTIRK